MTFNIFWTYSCKYHVHDRFRFKRMKFWLFLFVLNQLFQICILYSLNFILIKTSQLCISCFWVDRDRFTRDFIFCGLEIRMPWSIIVIWLKSFGKQKLFVLLIQVINQNLSEFSFALIFWLYFWQGYHNVISFFGVTPFPFNLEKRFIQIQKLL